MLINFNDIKINNIKIMIIYKQENLQLKHDTCKIIHLQK